MGRLLIYSCIWRTDCKSALAGEMDGLLLKKVEELTLYMIAQQKIIDKLVEKVRSLEEE